MSIWYRPYEIVMSLISVSAFLYGILYIEKEDGKTCSNVPQQAIV